jgi:hypothetical protein
VVGEVALLLRWLRRSLCSWWWLRRSLCDRLETTGAISAALIIIGFSINE